MFVGPLTPLDTRPYVQITFDRAAGKWRADEFLGDLGHAETIVGWTPDEDVAEDTAALYAAARGLGVRRVDCDYPSTLAALVEAW